jgi:hypothetical protein
MTMNNCDELGCDLVETTAHIGARPEHEAWQGKIFSLSGTSDKYPPFSICGLGEVDGICGINCRHSYYPYFEGLEEHYTEKELDEIAEQKVTYNGETMTRYEGEEKLRGMERNIRAYKRRALTQEAAGVDNTKARQKIGEWQAKARDFTKQTGIERDRAREFIGTIDGKQPAPLAPPKAQKISIEDARKEYTQLIKKYGDRNVNAVMYNYQDDEENGLGFFRIITLNGEAGSITVSTYSPTLDKDSYDENNPDYDFYVIHDAF